MQVENASGGLVSLAMCRELGPVLVALMITGRVGAAIAAEIGTMKVTEQVDALRAMAVEPVEYPSRAAAGGDDAVDPATDR